MSGQAGEHRRAACGAPAASGWLLAYLPVLPAAVPRAGAAVAGGRVTSHFTIGGHYPSLCHEELLDQLSRDRQCRALRRRGDADRARRPAEPGQEWRDIVGIAYIARHRRGGDAGAAARAGPQLAAIPVPTVRARAHRRLPDPSFVGEPRLHPALFILLDPHVLPYGARQGSSRAQAGQSHRGDE